MTKSEPAAHIRLGEADKTDSATLLRFYREVLVPHFRVDQMFAEDVFLAAQRSEALRTVLAWDDEDNLIGGITGHWYSTCQVFLLDYLAVRTEFRGGGAGGALLRYALDRWSQELSPILMVGEVEDPRQYHDVGFGNPQLRFRFYSRLGARALQLPYFQPALTSSGSRVHGLMLMVFLARPEAYAGSETVAVAGQPLECFIRQYVTECEGQLREDDPERELLLAACGTTDGVPLLPVGALPATGSAQ